MPKSYFEHNIPWYAETDEIYIKREAWIVETKDTIRKCLDNQQQVEGSLYTGAVGVVYMCCRALQSGLFSELTEDLVNYGKTYIQKTIPLYRVSNLKTRSSFYCGYAGFCFTAGLFSHILNDEKSKMYYANEYAAIVSEVVHSEEALQTELLTGISGLLCGVAEWAKKMNVNVIDKDGLRKLSDVIINKGKFHSSGEPLGFPICYPYHGRFYIGAAYGLSAVIQILMSFNEILEDKDKNALLRKTVDIFCLIQSPQGNLCISLEDLDEKMRNRTKETLVQWCHGAAGIIYLFARAYIIWKDDKYLIRCIRCGEIIWREGLLRKGPGLCHGIAGNAYAFLLLYRLTGNKDYLYRAICFAEFMYTERFKIESRIPDHPYSLFEGTAGTACFFMDLLNADTAEFPFFDIFSSVSMIS